MKSSQFVAAACALVLSATPASAAVVLLNTITSAYDGTMSGNPIAENLYTMLPFSTQGTNTITGIEAYASPASYDDKGASIGIMADVGGSPTGTFLQSVHVTMTFANPVVLSGLNWSVTPGTTYWLGVIGDPGVEGAWTTNFGGGAVGRYAFKNDSGEIVVPFRPYFLPQARVEGDFSSAVPEPSTWALMLLGFAGAGYMAWRRGRNTVAAAA